MGATKSTAKQAAKAMSPAQKRALLRHYLAKNPNAREKLRGVAVKQRKARAAMARTDINTFIPFVLRDEETGRPISQAPYHVEIQDMIDAHGNVVIWGHVELGKTQQVSVGRPLYELGRNPDLRIVIVQATATQAKKIVRTVAEYIEKNAWLKMVFPHLRPGKNQPWNTEQLTVERSPGIVQPSLQAIGAHGNILGARIDLLILDDILTMENTRTHSGRTDIFDWFKSTLMGRMTPNSRVVFLGNAWHPDDAMHRLASEGWNHARFPVRDPVSKKSRWIERWPEDRILSKSALLGPVESARQLDCQARSEDAARFKDAWIKSCLNRGKGLEAPHSLDEIPAGCFTFTGVDLGVKKDVHHDLTVLFTIMVRPDGSIQVIQCESGKWSSPDIINKIFETHRRYKSRILVEDNGAQDYLRQFATHLDDRVPIFPFNTRGRGKIGNKHHPQYGIEGLAAELANKQWIIPCDDNLNPDPQIKAWIQEMLYYDPIGHTGDRLMASWFAREGGRRRFTHRMAVAQAAAPPDMWTAEKNRLQDRVRNGYPSAAERKRQAVEMFWDEYSTEAL